jgi:hypothetical protein
VLVEMQRLDGIRRRGVYNKFYYGRFRNSHNIKVIIATVFEAVVLVLLTRGIYGVRR